MPTSTRIESYQVWSPDQFKTTGYQKDHVGLTLENDQWVNWVLSITLLLVLTLELVWTNQLSASVDKSLDAASLPQNVSATHNEDSNNTLNFKR